MSATLTVRQNDALTFIRTYQAETGYGPTYDEIAKGLGITAKSGVHRLIHGLVDRGALRKGKYRNRHYDIIRRRSA